MAIMETTHLYKDVVTGIGKLKAAEHIKAERLNLVSTMTDVLLP
jgi:hypothetical protein